jgi:hypothetical protein
MSLTSPSTLLLATAISGPALWQTFMTQQLDLTTGLTRFLIAVPVSAVMLALLDGLTSRYRSTEPPAPETTPQRRAGDLDGAATRPAAARRGDELEK